MLSQERLATIHGRNFAQMVGNATTGLFVSFRALKLHARRVAVPNSCCFNVALSVLLSGNIPVFVDISKSTLGMDALCLEMAAKKTNIDAVVAVHAYGMVCDIGGIASFCRQQGIPLIEDVACAMGAGSGNQPAGSFGDLAVFSFGSGKIIDVGHGGAVLFDAPAFQNILKRAAQDLPEETRASQTAVAELRRYLIRIYNQHFTLTLNSCWQEFRERALQTGKHILKKFAPAFDRKIFEAVNQLPQNLASRAQKARRLESLLHDVKCEIPFQPEGSVYWRFNVFIEKRNAILTRLLSKKIKASSWFPSADMLFSPRPNGSLTPQSDWVGDHILNLWVNDEVHNDYLETVASELKTCQDLSPQ